MVGVVSSATLNRAHPQDWPWAKQQLLIAELNARPLTSESCAKVSDNHRQRRCPASRSLGRQQAEKPNSSRPAPILSFLSTLPEPFAIHLIWLGHISSLAYYESQTPLPVTYSLLEDLLSTTGISAAYSPTE